MISDDVDYKFCEKMRAEGLASRRAILKRAVGLNPREAYAETEVTALSVIPAQAGIQEYEDGFRVSRCSPGMT